MTAPAVRRRRRPVTDVLLSVWGWLVMAFLFAPILVIVVYSFNDGRLLSAWGGFGFSAYEAAFANRQIVATVLVTIRVAIWSALLATVLGTMAGIALARRPGRWTVWFTALLLLVTVTPEIVDAVALLPWFVQLGTELGITLLNDGIVRLAIGSSLFSTAVVAYLVRSRLVGMDEHLEHAATDLYATPFQALTRVTLPLTAPAVLSGFLLSFTLSLDNTIIAAFVSVQGSTPWPVYILGSVRSGLRPEIAAMSTVMLVLTLLVLVLVAVVLRRSGDSTAQIARTMTGG
ncbi:ABC transporter permease [Agrococcus jejuensis]|uniref:Spermidine/putrescine transport system permease protein n=1 Tax=Agrococcus jejuensis TaxID=399736 RepID=A0A1G8BVD1_9MICO|nr:ABC transporter permease [Agrococcus jejuensis]SDH37177.1 spermidine/putrescine transport system permease protein [Agrococcus jejuensis]